MECEFKHDSWDPLYKEPFGAAPIGSEVTFRVRSERTVNIQLHTSFRGTENYYPMHQSPNDPNLYEVTIKMPQSTGLLWYDFHFDAFHTHYVYGAKPDGTGGEGLVNFFTSAKYQITVYDPKRKVPDWYKEGIMYQIFPDRFHHGRREGFVPKYPPKSLLHPNWNDKPHYFRRIDGSIDYWDFFGGNLLGVIEKLDYLKELGVTIIYLNPIFESISNHKYDTADYRKIAGEFGNDEIFQELCEEAEKRGMHVILDGVFNHTGDDSRYFNRYGTYEDELGAYQSKNSPYYSWYNFTDYPNEYDSWWGIRSMPSMDKTNPNFQHFIYSGDDSIVRHWLNKGASGWRLDVADELTDDFIVGIKEAMMTVNPDSVLIGEVWEDASNKISYGKQRDYFLGRELDSVMNYPFRSAMLNFFQGNMRSNDALTQMMSLYEHYPHENFMSNMNLIGSHDRKRALTALSDISDTEYMSELDRENFRLDESQLRLAKARMKLLVLVQMTFPGVPVIYYGDEAGMQGLEDPFNRGAFPWNNIDQELFEWYKKLTGIRTNSDVLKKGDFKPYWNTDADVMAYTRSLGDETVFVAVNRNPYKSYTIKGVGSKGKTGIDLITEKEMSLNKIELGPFEGVAIKIDQNK